MPIYEYGCSNCGNQFEVLIRSKTDFPDKCPQCGTPEPKKLLSAFAVASGDHKHNSECVSCPSAGTGCGGACDLDD